MTPAPGWTPSAQQVRWLLVAAMVPFMLTVVATWSHPPAATDGDYAHYLLHAKALAEGRPFDDIGYIYSRLNLIGPSVQPPAWPVVLAPFVAVFGTNLVVAKVLVTLLVAAFAVVVALYFIRRQQPIVGIAAAAAGPVALQAQYANGSALSDPLFCLLVWLLLIVADTDGRIGWRRATALVVICMAVMSTRIAGVAALPALVLYAWMRRREGRARLLVPLAACVLVALLILVVRFDQLPFFDRVVNGLRNFSIVKVATTYTVALATGALYPFDVNIADDMYHLVAAIPMVIGLVLFVRGQYRTALAAFIVFYVGVLVLAPVQEPRYAWPLIPLVMGWVTAGLLWVGSRYAPRALRPNWPKAVLGFVGVVTLAASIHLARRPARWSFYGDPDTTALFAWARAAGDSTGMRAAFTNPRVLTLETGVPAMGIPAGEKDEVLEEFRRKGITHVIVPLHRVERQAERRLRTIVEDHPELFPKIFSNAAHDVRLFMAEPISPAQDSGAIAAQPPQ